MDPVRATYLSAGCLILLGVVLTLTTDATYSGLMILPAIAAAAAYTLSPQIRWWFWKRNPPDLSTELAPLLDCIPLYRSLDLAGKREFRRRAFLIREATEFTGMAIDNIPPDVELMVAASAATVTYHREDFLVDGFENIVFYPHQFPTPVHERLHSSELYTPDGAIIYTLKYLIRSVVEPDKYLQLGIYEYCRALMYTDPELRAKLSALALNYREIEKITGFTETALRKFIGLEELDMEALTFTVFHTHSPRFSTLYVDKHGGIRELLNSNNPATVS